MTETKTAVRDPSRLARLRWAGPLAIGGSAALNGLIYLVADAFGAFPSDVVIPAAGQPMTIAPVVFTSAIGAFGATVAYALFDRYVADSDRRFRLVAALVLLASFVTPFTIPAASAAMIGTLLVMHVVVAAVSVWALTAGGQE